MTHCEVFDRAGHRKETSGKAGLLALAMGSCFFDGLLNVPLSGVVVVSPARRRRGLCELDIMLMSEGQRQRFTDSTTSESCNQLRGRMITSFHRPSQH